MSHLTNAVCFTCGLAIESPPKLTRLTNGQVCPACRDRVLEGLPPALPSRSSDADAASDSQGYSSESPESEGRTPDSWDEPS